MVTTIVATAAMSSIGIGTAMAVALIVCSIVRKITDAIAAL